MSEPCLNEFALSFSTLDVAMTRNKQGNRTLALLIETGNDLSITETTISKRVLDNIFKPSSNAQLMKWATNEMQKPVTKYEYLW